MGLFRVFLKVLSRGFVSGFTGFCKGVMKRKTAFLGALICNSGEDPCGMVLPISQSPVGVWCRVLLQ